MNAYFLACKKTNNHGPEPAWFDRRKVFQHLAGLGTPEQLLAGARQEVVEVASVCHEGSGEQEVEVRLMEERHSHRVVNKHTSRSQGRQSGNRYGIQYRCRSLKGLVIAHVTDQDVYRLLPVRG